MAGHCASHSGGIPFDVAFAPMSEPTIEAWVSVSPPAFTASSTPARKSAGWRRKVAMVNGAVSIEVKL